MCDNDVRGLALIKELQESQTNRDQNLEFSFRADGSLRVTGMHMCRGRRLSDLAAKWGKSATVRMALLQSSVTVDFRDDVGWKAVASVVTEQASAPSKMVSAVTACVAGDHVSVLELKHGGSTSVIRIRPTSAATIGTNALRNLLVTPMVVDLHLYGTYADVLVARTSNLVGGLAHIGSTSGFSTPQRRNHAGKQRYMARASRSYGRLCRWAAGAFGGTRRAQARRGDNYPERAS